MPLVPGQDSVGSHGAGGPGWGVGFDRDLDKRWAGAIRRTVGQYRQLGWNRSSRQEPEQGAEQECIVGGLRKV